MLLFGQGVELHVSPINLHDSRQHICAIEDSKSTVSLDRSYNNSSPFDSHRSPPCGGMRGLCATQMNNGLSLRGKLSKGSESATTVLVLAMRQSTSLRT